MARSVVREAARRVLVRRHRASGFLAERDRIADLRLLAGRDDAIIVDGGANKGDVTDLLLRRFSAPKIHAFEPIPTLAAGLRAKYASTPQVVVHAAALGDESGDVRFHVTKNPASSSLLAPTQTNREIHGRIVDVDRAITVSQVRLDEEVRDVTVVKLDLQGYELRALAGMTRLLPGIRAILLEVELMPMYDDQATFHDLLGFMENHGFRLFNIYEHWTTTDGQLLDFDAIFVNRLT